MKLIHTLVFCLAGFAVLLIPKATFAQATTNAALPASGVKTGNSLALSAANRPIILRSSGYFRHRA